MHVEYKSRIPERLRPKPLLPCQVEGFKDRVDRDAIAALNQIREIDRLAIGNDQIDFCMGHAETFDQVLHRGRREERFFQSFVLLLSRKMVVQFGVEAKRSAAQVSGLPLLAASWAHYKPPRH